MACAMSDIYAITSINCVYDDGKKERERMNSPTIDGFIFIPLAGLIHRMSQSPRQREWQERTMSRPPRMDTCQLILKRMSLN